MNYTLVMTVFPCLLAVWHKVPTTHNPAPRTTAHGERLPRSRARSGGTQTGSKNFCCCNIPGWGNVQQEEKKGEGDEEAKPASSGAPVMTPPSHLSPSS